MTEITLGDMPLAEAFVGFFKRFRLEATVLLIFEQSVQIAIVGQSHNEYVRFHEALECLKKEQDAKIIKQCGNETVGLEYEVHLGHMQVHVILLPH